MKKLLLCLIVAKTSFGQPVPDDLLKGIHYRNIGPFRTGAWITGFAAPPNKSLKAGYTFYVATRNGGLWKTVNNGTTFQNIFPHHHTIGAVAVAPSNPDMVWAGTGESYIARSSYAGDGIYLSTDAGKTWKNIGLKETQHIVRILVHPKNPNTVYVASPGHLFSSNPERGVFKTTDGGRSWKKIFFINDSVGAIDLVMHPVDPDILYTASYDKKRSRWSMESGGPKSAIYKTTDGGKTWKMLTNGLPGGIIGRIGIDLCKTKPEMVYAVVENLNNKETTAAAGNRQPEVKGGEVYRSEDGGQSWKKMSRPGDDLGGKAAYSFNQISVHPEHPDKVYVTGSSLANSSDGGRTWNDIDRERVLFTKSFGDVRTLWIDPSNPERMLFGSDGGVHITYDGGKTNDFHYHLPLGEVYAVGYDMEDPYNVYAGLQDHESWKGPSNGWSGYVTLENWVTVGSDDGMYNVVDPTDSRWLYNSGQFGLQYRVDQQRGIRTNIQPKPKEGEPRYRFGWVPPLLISPHNSKTIYTGAQMLLQSTNQGTTWKPISPDLTTNDPDRIVGKGHVQFCTITSIAESPKRAGLLWVGTDDGNVWLTRDGGTEWTQVTDMIAGAGGPKEKWVSRVTASSHEAGTAYVTKNGFREDVFLPYVFKTTDYGKTWKRIVSGLPESPVNVVVEDETNADLLFLGNDAGVYVSFNKGENWQALRGNLPVVPVHDLKIHPREKDLIVGTYGRAVWLADISWMQEVAPSIYNKPFHLFSVEPKYFRVPRLFGGNYQLYGSREIRTPNEPNGLVINFYAAENVKDSITLHIKNAEGKIIHQRNIAAVKGFNSVTWNFQNGRWDRSVIEDFTLSPGALTVTLDTGHQAISTETKFKGVKGWAVH